MATTFVATPQPGNSPPRTLLELEYTGQTSATITRADPDGRSRAVRLAEPATLSGGTWAGFDYESWFGQPATYTAVTAGGSLTTSTVQLDVSVAWLRHPGVPSLSLPIDFQGWGTPVRPVNQAVLDVLNRRDPIVVSDSRRKTPRGTLTLRTKTLPEATALLELFDDVTPLLLDLPPALGYGIEHYYLAMGDLTEDRLRPDYYPHPWRIWTCPYTVVDRPAGGLVAERTWNQVLVEQATWTQVKTTYDTWNDLLTGTT